MNTLESVIPDSLVDSALERLLDNYESKSKTFNLFLSGLTLTAFIFFFLAALPYFLTKLESRNSVIQMERIHSRLSEGEKELSAFLAVQNSVDQLKGMIEAGPQELREYIRFLSFSRNPDTAFPPDPTQFQMMQVSIGANAPAGFPGQANFLIAPPPELEACAGLDPEERVSCLVKARVKAQFGEYRRFLEGPVVEALGKLPSQGESFVQVGELGKKLEELNNAFLKHLESKPSFWKTYPGKEGFFVEIEEEFKNFWKNYGNLIDKESGRLSEEVGRLKSRKSSLEEKLSLLAERKRELAERIKEIESPLGRLPISLDEAMTWFPVALAVSFLFCAVIFGELVSLRRKLHELYLKKDPARILYTNETVAMIAPLWIDPVGGRSHRRMRSAVLAVPFVLYLFSCAFNLYDWAALDRGADRNFYSLCFYAAVYLAGLSCFMVGLGYFRRR